jgi:hypothetical protein
MKKPFPLEQQAKVSLAYPGEAGCLSAVKKGWEYFGKSGGALLLCMPVHSLEQVSPDNSDNSRRKGRSVRKSRALS